MTDYHDHDDCDEGPTCCKSCGVPCVDHLGLQGTCARLQEALAVLQATVDNCGCCDEPCSNCERAKAVIAKAKGRTT